MEQFRLKDLWIKIFLIFQKIKKNLVVVGVFSKKKFQFLIQEIVLIIKKNNIQINNKYIWIL
jgi:hypothetical protein